MATTLTSPNGSIIIGANCPVVLINDQLRVMDQIPNIFDELSIGKVDAILAQAEWGRAVGLDMVDVLINHPDLDEVELLPRIVHSINKKIGCPISLDTRNPQALEAALKEISPYKALINSVTAEKNTLEVLLPLAKKYGAALIGMPIGHIHGMPRTAEGRVVEARVILDAAEAAGIPRQDIILDAICLASSAEPDTFQVTIETLQRFHQELNSATVLGIGNAGFGMPEAVYVDLAYLIGAVPSGLDAAIVNPTTPGLIETVRAIEFLTGRDPSGRGYIKNYRAKKKVGKTL